MTPAVVSSHYANERQNRSDFISNSIGRGNVIDEFIVNRGDERLDERHSVTDTAIIIIHNNYTKKLITEIIARPEQLRRLYHSNGKEPPRRLLRMAYKHNQRRYNEI